MNMQKYDGSIIIVKDSIKTNFIENLRKTKLLLDIKVMGLEEFKKKYYFDYTNKAIYYVHKNYHCIKDIAKIYIDNLYYIKDIDDEKVQFLNTIKNDLISNNFLIEDKNFRQYIKGKKIVLYNLKNVDKFYEMMFEELETFTEVEEESGEGEAPIVKALYQFPCKENEIAFIASEIAELIESGVDINRIKIANITENYIFTIRRIFNDFKIPINLLSNETISSTLLVKKFKECFSSDIASTLETLKPFVKDDESEKIYGKIVDVLNDYCWCSNYLEVKDFIIDDVNRIKMPKLIYKNAVNTIDFIEDTIQDEDYIFLINFNQGVIPVNKKDEDYLNDETKNKLGISDSVDINKRRIREVQKRIKSTKNLTVTYSKWDLGSELYISNAYQEELFNECQYIETYTHSNAYNKKLLLCEKDENKKYGTKTDRLKLLNCHYKDEPYNNYDNAFKGIDKTKLKTHLQNRLTLSYSRMNTYYQCGFRYYLDNILKINKFEDSFETVVGNIFHKILSLCFESDFDFESTWNKTIEEQTFEFKEKENFFLGILKDELKFIIEAIKKEREYTSLDKSLYEKEIIIPIDEENGVSFKGFIDKIRYGEFEDRKVVSIIDYKTGNPELNIDNVIYGLEMQLPIYAYLIKKSAEFKDARIGGFYLQKILNNIKDENERIKSLKLQGYSNSSLETLSKVDSSYMDSKMIKSLKMTNDKFYYYSKILSDTEIDKLTSIVEDKIKEASSNILEAKFDIDPKQVGDKLLGCKYCKYKDICYMKNSDIKKLKKKSKKDFLGGETDAEMD